MLENYRSTRHIIDCANRIIAPARDRMKATDVIRVNHARRDQPDGGEQAARDALVAGRVHVLEVPSDPLREALIALDELQRLQTLLTGDLAAQWGSFAVIARRWADLEPLAALCRLRSIPASMERDAEDVKLHHTREGHTLLALLRGELRQAPRRRMLLRAGALGRWFRMRYRCAADSYIAHPCRAALAQFISDSEAMPGNDDRVISDLIEALYDSGEIGRSRNAAHPNAPLRLMTAHRAKGLEFDHVLVLDCGGWQGSSDDERRLYYVAMTRARHSLTLCSALGAPHPFIGDAGELPLRSRPQTGPPPPGVRRRIQYADPRMIVLSWPGYFSAGARVHRAIAALDVGSHLTLRPRSKGEAGWELATPDGETVGRMAAVFQPPAGTILAVRVRAILVRKAKEDASENLRCQTWELVLPEIEYLPEA